MFILKKAFVLFLTLSVLSAYAQGRHKLDECLQFKAPEQKSAIAVPYCTLGVISSCKKISNVEIRARYCPAASDTLVESKIGFINVPPYLKVWNLSDIPNQLTIGVGIQIIVNFEDGDVYGLLREGIFLSHKKIVVPAARNVAYEYAGSGVFPQDTIRMTSSPNGPAAFAQMYWSEKGITVRVSVSDPKFVSSVKSKALEHSGIEVLLDPSMNKRFYPSDEVMRFVVPLSGKPYRVNYQPIFKGKRTYQLKQSAVTGVFDYSVDTVDRSGFTVTFTIPRYLIGKSLPPEAGYNIIVKTIKKRMFSLVNAGNGFNHYSPLLWPSLTFAPKPFLKARWLVFLLSFASGLIVPLLAYLFYSAVTRKRPIVLMIKVPESEKNKFEKIKEAVDRQIIHHDLSAASVALEINVGPEEVETVVKSATGLPFAKYLMYLRTEIARERLRSSFSSQEAIAESCGFRSVKEFERWFRRFHSATPQNFRKEQQVTQTK